MKPKRKKGVALGGSTDHGTVDVPEGALLAVEDLALQLVALLVDARLRLGLRQTTMEHQPKIKSNQPTKEHLGPTCMKMNSHLRENIFWRRARFSAS